MKWSLLLGRVSDVEVRAHISLLLLIPLVVFYERSGSLGGIMVSSLFLITLFICIFLHELGHTLIAQYYGIQVRSIILWPLGGLATLSRAPARPLQSLFITAAGPLVNLLLMAGLGLAAAGWFVAGVAGVLLWPDALPVFRYIVGLILLLALINLGLALLNLLPIFPMDGGQITRAALQLAVGQNRADTITMAISLPLALGLGVFGFVQGDVITVALAILFTFATTSLNRKLRQTMELGLLYLVERGGFYQRQKQYDRAVAWYTHKLGRRLSAAQAHRFYNNRGAAYLCMGDYQSALADFERLISLQPEYAPAYSNRGLVAHLAGDYDSALADFERAIQLKAGLAYPYINRGRLYRDRGNTVQALADCNEAIRLHVGTASFYFERAAVRYSLGDTAGALADGDQALRLSPSEALVQDEPFLAMTVRGRLDWALAYYRQARQLLPNSPLPYQGRADAYRINGQVEQAIAEYSQALRLAPQQAELYLGRGRAYHQQGNFTQAAADLFQVLALSDKAHLRQQARELLRLVSAPLASPLSLGASTAPTSPMKSA